MSTKNFEINSISTYFEISKFYGVTMHREAAAIGLGSCTICGKRKGTAKGK